MMDVNDFKIGLIYRYTSPSGKMYIGQTINEKSRNCQHKTQTILADTYFAKAIRKYGFDNLEYEVLISFKPTIDKDRLKRVLDKLEQRYIKLYKTNIHEFGYNLNEGGNGNLGYEHTEEALTKITQYQQNKTEEHKHNLSIASLGVKKSEETKAKMSASKKNKKQVEKYNLEDNLIDTFNSIEDAAKSLVEGVQKTKANKIGECCNGKRKTIYNFIWKFKVLE
jgi:group I intron endonuclease